MDKPNKHNEHCHERSMNTNFEEIFHQSPIGILLYDKEGKLTNANDSALKIAKIPRLDDVLGTNIFDNHLIASKKEDLHEKGLIKFQDTLNLIKISEQNIYSPSELKIIDIDWTVSMIESGYMVQIQDITSRKKAEEQADFERRRLETILEAIPSAMVLVESDGKFSYLNKRVKELYGVDYVGYDLDSHITKVKAKRFDGSPFPLEDMPVSYSLKFGENIHNVEMIIERTDSKQIPVSVSSAPLFDTLGKISSAIVIFEDITEQKKGEEKLRESEKRFRAVQENSLSRFTILKPFYDAQGEIIDFTFDYQNAPAAKSTGNKPEELIGHRMVEIWPTFPKTRFFEMYKLAMETSKVMEFEQRYNYDGMDEWFYVKITPIPEGIAIATEIITEQKKAEKALQESEERYSEFFTNPIVGLGLCRVEVNGKGEPIDYIYLEVNDAFEEFTGLKREKIINKGVKEVLPEDADNLVSIFGPVGLTGKRIELEVPIPSLGRIYNVSAYSPSPNHFIAIFSDITERKKTEEEIKQSNDRFNMAQKVSNVGTFEWNIKAGINTWTPELEAMYGLQVGEFPGTQEAWEELLHPEDKQKAINGVDIALETGELMECEWRVIWPDESIHWLFGRWKVFKDDNGEPLKMIGVNIDITELKKAEEALVVSEKRYRELFNSMTEMFQVIELIYDTKGKPLDYFYRDVNPAFCGLVGKTREDLIDKRVKKIFGIVEDYWLEKYDEVAKTGNPIQFENYGAELDKWYEVNVWKVGENQVAIIFTDTTERKHHEEREKKFIDELTRSNTELERFAYVSSHDLQEPLRMVTLYSQLLEKRYKDRLDSDADDFIEYIVENAKRMKYLIDDLLEYSRITSQAKEFENIDLDILLESILSNLSIIIVENNVNITHDSLPTVFADKNQILQVFQNLITNAIKFRGKKSPKINISAQKGQKEWIFAIKDNGIGIHLKHREQIFKVFKRLHTREEYPGTGIGLSIVQKIIERHNGRIWVESELGKGSTFFFTIPIN